MKQKLLFLLVLLMTAATNTWAQEPVAKDIVVSPESGTNISDAIKDALGTNGDWALNITINLAKGGTYTVTESIVPSASITINGNGATIDASGLTTHFIMMSKTPGYDKVASGQYVVTTPSKIENVTITGLTNALFYDNSTPYAFEDFTIDNCLINYSAQGSVIIRLSASMVINFTITNSTFYCLNKNQSTANCIEMSGKRPWQITGFENSEGKLLVDHNTFYNVAYKKQFFTSNTLKGQTKYKYEFNSNIFVNVSFKKIYGNMTNNKNQLTTDGKNTYLWDGTFFSETNYNGDEGLKSDPLFKDADNGDFTVGRSTDQFANKTGDPRWTTFKVTLQEGTEDADKWTVKVGEGEAQAFPVERLEGGETVTVTYSGSKKVLGVKAEKKAAAGIVNPEVGQIIGSDGKNYDANATLPTGVTAVAKICYVGSETGVEGYTHGLALALTDEASAMNWTTATGASGAAAHTPAAPTTTSSWMLPSKDQWEKMITAAGGFTALRDGFSGISGASNMPSGAYYWSSTEIEATRAWDLNSNQGNWINSNKSYADGVRACLAF